MTPPDSRSVGVISRTRAAFRWRTPSPLHVYRMARGGVKRSVMPVMPCGPPPRGRRRRTLPGGEARPTSRCTSRRRSRARLGPPRSRCLGTPTGTSARRPGGAPGWTGRDPRAPAPSHGPRASLLDQGRAAAGGRLVRRTAAADGRAPVGARHVREGQEGAGAAPPLEELVASRPPALPLVPLLAHRAPGGRPEDSRERPCGAGERSREAAARLLHEVGVQHGRAVKIVVPEGRGAKAATGWEYCASVMTP
jgi:hypothetical protein